MTVSVFVEKRVCAVLFLSVWFAGTVCCWESESSCWWSDRTLIWTSRNNTWMTLWSPQLSVYLLVTILADVSRAFGTYAMECIKSLHKSSLYSCQTCPDLTQTDQKIRRKKTTVGHHPTQPCCLKSRHDCKSDIWVTAAILEGSGMAAR